MSFIECLDLWKKKGRERKAADAAGEPVPECNDAEATVARPMEHCVESSDR
jgi:hypothetical protein